MCLSQTIMEYDTVTETQILEKYDFIYLNLSVLFRGRSRSPAIGEWPGELRCSSLISRIPGQIP